MEFKPTQNLISKEKLSLISATELENLREELEAYRRLSEVSVHNCDEEGCKSKLITNGYLEEFIGCKRMFSCDFQIECEENHGGNYCNTHRDIHLSALKQKDGQVWWACKLCRHAKVNSPDFQQWVSFSDNYARNN